jgi:hypothetical protein
LAGGTDWTTSLVSLAHGFATLLGRGRLRLNWLTLTFKVRRRLFTSLCLVLSDSG